MLQQTSLTHALAQSQRTPRVGKTISSKALGTGWQQVADVLQLPNSMYSFLVFFIMLLLVAGSMVLHVLLSVQVSEKQATLNQLNVQLSQIQRENAELVWQINQTADLGQVYEQAISAGYEPMVKRKFVLGNQTLVSRLEENQGVALNQP